MIATTSHTVEHLDVQEYKGIVVSDVTAGRHVGKDFLAGIRNFFGGRSKSWEKTLREAQQQALRELVDEAEKQGANAVIAIEMEDEAIGQNGGMMNVKATGTAVVVEEE
ncbi:MAG: YbjQ family protein [Candidatus Nanohaloarchaea archaeon]|nr:YbjQ family protein [Candidatus Nanohaloarchaea archaeon]